MDSKRTPPAAPPPASPGNGNNQNRSRNFRRGPRHHSRPRPAPTDPNAPPSAPNSQSQNSPRPQGPQRTHQNPPQGRGQGQGQGQGSQRRDPRDNRDNRGNRQQSDQRSPRSRDGTPQHHNSRHSPLSNQQQQQKRPLTAEEIHKKYWDLLEGHNSARKKYYDNFHKVSDHQRTKLEKEFFQTGENLRRFENNLSLQHKAILFKGTLKSDITYSSNHELATAGDAVEPGPFSDPHLTKVQYNRTRYADDKEESVGSMDDYLKIKNK